MVLWLAIIALESTDLLSAQHTSGILYSIATALFGHIDPQRFAVFHAVVRKVGHFVGYGVLSVLFFRALRGTVAATVVRLCALSVAFTFMVAGLDEWHQTSLASRTGTLYDLALDTFGALCMQAAVLLTRKPEPRIYTDVHG